MSDKIQILQYEANNIPISHCIQYLHTGQIENTSTKLSLSIYMYMYLILMHGARLRLLLQCSFLYIHVYNTHASNTYKWARILNLFIAFYCQNWRHLLSRCICYKMMNNISFNILLLSVSFCNNFITNVMP